MPYSKNDRSGDRRPAPKKPFHGPRPDHRERTEKPEPAYENVVAGRNAVLESLKQNERIDTIFIAQGQATGSILKIISMAKENGYPVKEVNESKLAMMAGAVNHQGVVLTLSEVAYAEVSDILARAKEREEAPFLIIADEIEDPHNLGALIRTAETAGAHGIIIPKRRNVGLTAAVFKASAGAAAHLPVARVSNLTATVEELKEAGIWIYGCDMEGQTWCETNFSGGVALIVGSEGKGMSRLLKEHCDVLVTLPMKGAVSSLNASVAGGIVMYEVLRQRMALKPIMPK